jgi:multiple sugar transport system substrate-binding protein
MDEKVLFNNPPTQDEQQNPSPPETPPGGEPADQQPADESADTTDQGAAGEEAAEGGEEYVEESPGGIGGFLGGGLLKKLLIGIGSIILLTIVIIMLIPKGQPDKSVTLTWWGLWEDNSTMQSLILDYKKTHPNVTINYIKNDPGQYLDRLQARMQNGTGPDIFLYHNTWLPMLNGELSPLSTNVITPDQFKQYYYPVMQQDLTQNGAIYGLPLEADSLALFVNPDLFEAAGVQVPSSWDDFVKAAKQLTVKDPDGKIKTAGAALGTYANINHAPDIISLLFLQQGVDMNKFAASTKSESDALKFYTSFAQGQDNVWDGTLDNSLLAFSKGNLAMYFGFSWDVFEIQKLNPNLNFKIYPVPSLYGKKTTLASYWVEGVSSKSPNQQAAMDFMQYLAQKSTAQAFYSETSKVRSFGEPYARKDMAGSLQENQLVYPFVQGLDDAGSSFFASDTKDGDTGINSMMNTYLQTAVNTVDEDGTSADSAVADLQNGVAQVLQKYGIQQQ